MKIPAVNVQRPPVQFYYLTVMNENSMQPSLSAGVGKDIQRGVFERGNSRLVGAVGAVASRGKNEWPIALAQEKNTKGIKSTEISRDTPEPYLSLTPPDSCRRVEGLPYQREGYRPTLALSRRPMK